MSMISLRTYICLIGDLSNRSLQISSVRSANSGNPDPLSVQGGNAI